MSSWDKYMRRYYRDLDSFTDVRTGSDGDMARVHKAAGEELNMVRCYMCGELISDNHQCLAQATRVKARHEFTTKHEAHLEYIKHEAAQRLDNKYRAGVEEHGGNLQDLSMRSLLENALDEAIDQVVYLLSALENLG